MSAYMRCHLRHLYLVNSIVLLKDVLEILFPMECYRHHPLQQSRRQENPAATALILSQIFHAFLMVFQITLFLFLLSLLTSAVKDKALDGRNQECDAEAEPHYQKCCCQNRLQHCHRFSPVLSYARKSSSSAVSAKSSSTRDLPPRGSPSAIFWRLFRPQAMPLLPLELKA